MASGKDIFENNCGPPTTGDGLELSGFGISSPLWSQLLSECRWLLDQHKKDEPQMVKSGSAQSVPTELKRMYSYDDQIINI